MTWYGNQRAGWYTYTEAERVRVVSLLLEHCAGPGQAMTAEEFQVLCEPVSPRQVQQILSDRDGIDYLLSRSDRKLFVCQLADEGLATTKMLKARAASELARVARREMYAGKMAGQRALL